MEFVSIIIPTYNRAEELLLTLPQIVKYMDENSELIIMDQSDNYDPIDNIEELKHILEGINVKHYHCKVPSVPLAWNTAANLAIGDILLFIDDDIDINFNLLDGHRKHYLNNPSIVGVAGGYYASSLDRVWVPSSNNGTATTLAGVNSSFKRDVFLEAGSASAFVKSFAGFDWELAEHFVKNYGKLAVGDDVLVFHRAPAIGGCQNQAAKGIKWYYGCYFNHSLWILWRKFPFNLSRLPRHFYWIYRYCTPKKELLLSLDFWREAVFKGMKDANQQYKKDSKSRVAKSYNQADIKCIIEHKNQKNC